jgi:hypothetical protein
MIAFDLELAGYRLFSHDTPLMLRLDAPVIAVVGPYRSGKAAALKWMYELRCALLGAVTAEAEDGEVEIRWPEPLRGGSDVFCAQDPESVIRLMVRPVGSIEPIGTVTVRPHPTDLSKGLIRSTGRRSAAFRSVMSTLAAARFYGGFRSALNINSDLRYFDLNRAEPFRHRADRKAAQRACEAISELFSVTVFPLMSADALLGLCVGGRQFAWPSFGSGLTQFFAVLYQAMVESASLILIEEPELHVDSDLRVRFVTALASFARCGVVFATSERSFAEDAADRVLYL